MAADKTQREKTQPLGLTGQGVRVKGLGLSSGIKKKKKGGPTRSVGFYRAEFFSAAFFSAAFCRAAFCRLRFVRCVLSYNRFKHVTFVIFC